MSRCKLNVVLALVVGVAMMAVLSACTFAVAQNDSVDVPTTMYIGTQKVDKGTYYAITDTVITVDQNTGKVTLADSNGNTVLDVWKVFTKTAPIVVAPAASATSTVPAVPISPTVAVPATTAPAWTLDCKSLSAPPGGQVYWSNKRNGNTDPYAVVYDPSQGGSADHPALGWWYQPCLPSGPARLAHDVAIVLPPAEYRYTGPECTAYLNSDGKSPWEKGTIIINRQNVQSGLLIKATSGTSPAEAWVGIKCRTSWASGFSFEKLSP
jgi:hypothetical protein